MVIFVRNTRITFGRFGSGAAPAVRAWTKTSLVGDDVAGQTQMMTVGSGSESSVFTNAVYIGAAPENLVGLALVGV